MNNKGSFNAILIIAISCVLILAFAFASSLFTVVSNQIIQPFTSTFNGLGDNVSGTNFTDITRMTLVPVQASIHSLDYIFGVIYFIAIFLLIGLSVAFKTTDSKWIIPIFIILAIFVLMISIVVSNSYEDLLNGGDIVASGLSEQTLLTYGMVYSPLIMLVTIILSGIIMFTGKGGSDY